MRSEVFCLTGRPVSEEPYLYRACGLEGIYLLNGYSVETIDGEEHETITNIDGLHEAIGRHLVVTRKALAPKEVRFLRNTMGLTQDELAKMLGNNAQSVARWEKGQTDVPGASEKLLRTLFLASVMTKSEFDAFREFLMSKLRELDALDELRIPPAQFEFTEHWQEKKAA